jgi:hypothetical protein
MLKVDEIRTWVENQQAAGQSVTLGMVAHEIRNRFCRHRRFEGPAYILRNGSTKRVYGDAFSEELLGERDDIASMCARWPMTKECFKALKERKQHWEQVLGVDTTFQTAGDRQP